MQVILQRFIGNKLVDQHSLPTSDAIPFKGHQVPMMNTADDLNLSLKLSLPLSAARFQALHRHFFAAGKDTFVHEPEPALSQHVLLGKPACGGGELVVSEGALVESPHRDAR